MSAGIDVELRAVTRRFGGVSAVDRVDLEILHAEFLSLLGPSGCGKTTTLRLIAGFERPDAGSIHIGFVYVTHDQEEALAMSDRVAVMNAGRIEQLGTPQDVYDRPATTFVAGFIGDTNFVRHGSSRVAVRPEGLRVARNGDGLPGAIVAVMTVGPSVQIVVRLDDGQEVVARRQRTGGEPAADALAEGDRVTVSWADGEALDLKEAMLR